MARTMKTAPMSAEVIARRRKRAKDRARNVSSANLLKEGDWLDVMDGDGVWNVARVLSVPSPQEVEITYDGWEEEYDEVVRIDSDRVAPYHTFTWAVKCWVKYLNWPLWPSLITIRTPGTPEGIRNLAAENRLYVDFLDNPNFAKRDRCWQKRTLVRTFEDNYDKKRTDSTGEHFERSLGWVLQSDASTKMPKFTVGTLPMEYKFSPTESVAAVRRNMGDKLWFQNFTLNRMRHQQNHVYEILGDEDDDASVDDSSPPTLRERWLNLSPMKEEEESQTITNDKNQPPNIKTKLDRRMEVEIPYELETMDSSDDSGTEGEQENNRRKRRRLRTKRRSDGLSKSKKVERKERRNTESPERDIPQNPLGRRHEVEDGSSHSKGRLKMVARRSVPPLDGVVNLPTSGEPVKLRSSGAFSDEADDEGEKRLPIVYQLDTVSMSAAKHRRGRPKGNERETNTNVIGPSIILPRRVTDRQTADAERQPPTLIKEMELASRQCSARKQVRLTGPSLSSTDVNTTTSPCVGKIESHRSMRSSSKLPRKAGKKHSLLPCEEMTTGDSVRFRQHSMELDNSFLSASKSDSSDSDEAKYTSNEKIAESVQNNIKESESKEQSIDKDSAVVVTADEQPHGAGTNNDDRYRSSQRFCVMQADGKDAPEVITTNKVKGSNQTTISVPRKFNVASGPQVPACCTNSPPRIAPPRLSVSTSGIRGAALSSPSAAVFSSSNGFSMQSWFKRKLMADYMSDGVQSKTHFGETQIDHKLVVRVCRSSHLSRACSCWTGAHA